jgi:hypothetical protein
LVAAEAKETEGGLAGGWADGGTRASDGRRSYPELDPNLFLFRYGLGLERPGETCIELRWSDGRDCMDRETELAIEELCCCLVLAMGRLATVPVVRSLIGPAQQQAS